MGRQDYEHEASEECLYTVCALPDYLHTCDPYSTHKTLADNKEHFAADALTHKQTDRW